jgi:hypothetical protein
MSVNYDKYCFRTFALVEKFLLVKKLVRSGERVQDLLVFRLFSQTLPLSRSGSPKGFHQGSLTKGKGSVQLTSLD